MYKVNDADSVFGFEAQRLSEFATLSRNTKGRLRPMQECDIRTPFSRDRDRITHSKAFRRLMHKTQVFLTPEGDHYRTRLTHTFEVTQIARVIARALGLNEDLTEAAALGHDLGHTPFGHAGERLLNSVYEGGFAHYEQSLRVADLLENNGMGLNLTYEVRDAIRNHSGSNRAITPEGRIIKFADRIAYINHDIDDAIRAGIMKSDDIPRDLRQILGDTHGVRINTLVRDTIFNSKGAEIRMSPEIDDAMNRLREFMFEAVYKNPVAKGEEEKANVMLTHLYEHFYRYPEKLPPEYRNYLDRFPKGRVVCDYISSMTDRYAVRTFNELFVPKVWRRV
ncbi:MAG: deoxyguanosinetriphosphate triphosphohydrolase [Ruminococcaceae bacterium]|nr:deoxyguanosinetriphosphate triphosphohydrolase [Oscillospiraceae bacterium]